MSSAARASHNDRPAPAEHWIHLRTTNPIESTFATVRHRTKVTKGPGSRAAGLAMAFKLTEAARPITPADPQYAKAWRRYHDTHDRAGRR